jgi:polar amino acid transport system substrate-binding protein
MDWTADVRIVDIVRAGKLRVALFLPLYTHDPATGQVRAAGVEGTYLVEIAHALATRIGIDVELLGYATPAEAMNGLTSHGCDLGFFGIDPTRSNQVDFSPPFVRADFTYLVPAGSTLRTISDVDRSHVRIAAVRNHNSTAALTANARHAQLIYGNDPDATFRLLQNQQADAMASVRTLLLEYSSRLPGSQVLDGCYGELLLAIAIPKGQPDRLAYISEFVEDAKAFGIVQSAIDAAGARGVQVAALSQVKLT